MVAPLFDDAKNNAEKKTSNLCARVFPAQHLVHSLGFNIQMETIKQEIVDIFDGLHL